MRRAQQTLFGAAPKPNQMDMLFDLKPAPPRRSLPGAIERGSGRQETVQIEVRMVSGGLTLARATHYVGLDETQSETDGYTERMGRSLLKTVKRNDPYGTELAVYLNGKRAPWS